MPRPLDTQAQPPPHKARSPLGRADVTEVSGACPFNNYPLGSCYASITCYCYGDKIAIKIKTDTVSAIAEAEVKWRRQIFNNWNPQCAPQRTILSPGGGEGGGRCTGPSWLPWAVNPEWGFRVCWTINQRGGKRPGPPDRGHPRGGTRGAHSGRHRGGRPKPAWVWGTGVTQEGFAEDVTLG